MHDERRAPLLERLSEQRHGPLAFTEQCGDARAPERVATEHVRARPGGEDAVGGTRRGHVTTPRGERTQVAPVVHVAQRSQAVGAVITEGARLTGALRGELLEGPSRLVPPLGGVERLCAASAHRG